MRKKIILGIILFAISLTSRAAGGDDSLLVISSAKYEDSMIKNDKQVLLRGKNFLSYSDDMNIKVNGTSCEILKVSVKDNGLKCEMELSNPSLLSGQVNIVVDAKSKDGYKVSYTYDFDGYNLNLVNSNISNSIINKFTRLVKERRKKKEEKSQRVKDKWRNASKKKLKKVKKLDEVSKPVNKKKGEASSIIDFGKKQSRLDLGDQKSVGEDKKSIILKKNSPFQASPFALGGSIGSHSAKNKTDEKNKVDPLNFRKDIVPSSSDIFTFKPIESVTEQSNDVAINDGSTVSMKNLSASSLSPSPFLGPQKGLEDRAKDLIFSGKTSSRSKKVSVKDKRAFLKRRMAHQELPKDAIIMAEILEESNGVYSKSSLKRKVDSIKIGGVFGDDDVDEVLDEIEAAGNKLCSLGIDGRKKCLSEHLPPPPMRLAYDIFDISAVLKHQGSAYSKDEKEDNFYSLSKIVCEYENFFKNCSVKKSESITFGESFENLRKKHKMARCKSKDEIDTSNQRRVVERKRKRSFMSLLGLESKSKRYLNELVNNKNKKSTEEVKQMLIEYSDALSDVWKNEMAILDDDIKLRKREKRAILKDYLPDDEYAALGDDAYRMNLYMNEIEKKSEGSGNTAFKLRSSLLESKEGIKKRQEGRVQRREIIFGIAENIENTIEKIQNNSKNKLNLKELNKIKDIIVNNAEDWKQSLEDSRRRRGIEENKLLESDSSIGKHISERFLDSNN